MKRLTIWHTNDVHSHLEHWPRIFSFLRKKRIEAEENALFFDIGDYLDRVHPLTEGTNGLANVDLLNQLPFDAVTIGNNEGTTLSHDKLAHLYDHAAFPVVCCNVYADQARTKHPDWAHPVIYFEKSGLKIAVIGATAPFSEYYEALGWGIEEPLQAIKREVAALPEDVSTVILLSHLGLPTDERIAAEIPEIDVILGGHTHHLLEDGKQIEGTLLAACGRWGEYVGKIELVFSDDGRLQTKQAVTFPTETLPAPADEEAQIEAYFEKGKDALAEKVVALPAKLSHNWFGDSQIADLFYEAACEWTHADSFLTNAGIYMTDLGPGNVTAFDIHQLLPHPLNLIVLSMTGRELGVLIEEIDRKQAELQDIPLRGFGFRGEYFGAILLKRGSYDREKEVALWDNMPIDLLRTYRIATHDTFVFAPFFPIIKQIKQKDVYTPELLRDILTWKLKKRYQSEEEHI
ncbi:bifunctional metallophosphatase/5'-nucleotidase [Listeria ilorinensis]|uniref:bifunctional metallophosphatase/5'-nucleotidase n=1 Tax=Listeria ilorinensis TaxID=2867439 RepID=UPI001EF5A84B|nr:bifunctional UDP-sugar hydrolase/5'-nucleotidase [Listeria ilorinensis]